MIHNDPQYISVWVRIWYETEQRTLPSGIRPKTWITQVFTLPDGKTYYFDTPEDLLRFLGQALPASEQFPASDDNRGKNLIVSQGLHNKEDGVNNKQLASTISWGIFIIGLGLLFWSEWWWPGVMLVLGVSAAAELLFRGRAKEALGTFAFFLAIPVVYALIASVPIPWETLIAVALIAGGGMLIGKAILARPAQGQN